MKLYTEKQYREYAHFMLRMSTDNIIEGIMAHSDYKGWIEKNNISETAENQMGDRLERECKEEMNKREKKGKVIKFPKQDSGEGEE